MRNVRMNAQQATLLATATITTAASHTEDAVVGFAGVTYLVAVATFVYGSGGTNATAYVQTSLDNGTSWLDIMSFQFTTASAVKVSAVSTGVALTAATTGTDGALTANTIVNGLLGDRFRVKWVTTGTYAGGTTLGVSVVAKG